MAFESPRKYPAGPRGLRSEPVVSLWLAALVISMMLLTGCSGKQSAGGGNIAEDEKAPKEVNPPYPGHYLTKEIDGAQLLQGRFEAGSFGGTLVRSMVGSDPKMFNPWTATDSRSSELGELMFASLMRTDMYNGETIPYMAEKFTVENDGVTYTTTLRKGITWSDGQPITSDDVAFTWNEIIAKGYGNSSLRDITTVEGKSPTVTVVDEYTNKYVTAKPFAPFKRIVGGIPIAPKHIIEPILNRTDGRKAFAALWAADVDPKSLVTSGPFTLERFVPSQRVEMARTKNFFMVSKEGKRLPYLDKIVYVIVPDVQTNLLKFRGGEIDITQVRSRDTFQLLKLRKKGNFSLYNLGQGAGTTFAMFNLCRRKNSKTGKPYVDPIKSKWFNDRNFRQAVNHSINRKAMVANYFKGLGYPSFTCISPNSPFINKSLKPFKPDRKFAMQLLTDSGFKKDKEGRLLDREGNLVEFDLTTASGGTFLPTICNMLIEDLKKLGMKVNFQEINFNILMDKVHTSLDWDCCVYALTGDLFEPHNGANVFKSDARLHLFDQRQPDKDGNILVTDARPWEKRLDKLFYEGAITMDTTERKNIYGEYQQIVYDEAPFIYLCDAMNIIGVRNTVNNYTPTNISDLVQGLHNIEEIWKAQ